MANKDTLQGLAPYGKVIHAGSYVAGATIYPGDMVKMDNAGLLAVCAAGTASCVGVALNYAVATGTVLVSDNAEQEYIVQCDDGTVAAQTNMGLNYDITVGTASTLYKRSAMQLDASTGATDSNLPLRALRLAPAVDNAFGSKADVIVKLNNNQRANATVGL
jgi:hypothetical protein